MKYRLKELREFINLESLGGLLLFAAALLAIIMSNTKLESTYVHWIHLKLSLNLGALTLEKTLTHWVNDGLMALFFLLVGVEIKREMEVGALSDKSAVVLPTVGALGGLLIPALVYYYLNLGDPIAMRGWAIPVATDIAFSLGILSLLGSRVPIALKVFLTALAIIDDIIAVLIIALFYTASLSWLALLGAAVVTGILIFLNQCRVFSVFVYLLLGALLWFFTLKSGVHATVAGVILAFTLPLKGYEGRIAFSPAIRLEHGLHPWVTYLVLPIFAFTNAGFSFEGLNFSSVIESIPLGITLGLFLGKQVGILGGCLLIVRFGFATLPEGVNWRNLYGVAILCGVGFTMSLFIGGLAFDNLGEDYTRLVRLGVLAGSLLSGLVGYIFLRLSAEKNSPN